jgi:hypothetical protein
MTAVTIPESQPSRAATQARASQVSVIMCVHVGDRLGPLREAVSSVFAQTHADLVLRIFVDGPVADDVRAYLEGLADARACVELAATNRGLAAGLNRLIDASLREGCEVIARMDADDICHPDRLAKQLAFLARHPEVAVLGAGCVEFDEDTGKESLERLPADDRTLKRGLVRRTPFVHSTVVFRAEVFRGGTRYRALASEDMHLWVDLARYGWIFANLQEPLIRHRISDALFQQRSRWAKVGTELTARTRGMTELCMLSPANIAWTGGYLLLRLLPRSLARRAYRYFRLRA